MAFDEEVLAVTKKFAASVDSWTAAREALRKAKKDTAEARAELEAVVEKYSKK